MRTDLHRVFDPVPGEDDQQWQDLQEWEPLSWIEQAGERLVGIVVYAAFGFIVVGLWMGWI